MVERRRATMPPQRRLPQPIGDLLYFFLIGAVVGAVYGHMIAVSEGAPLLGFWRPAAWRTHWSRVFLGDTVITAARIQEFCRQTGDRVLASAALVNLLKLPFGITKRPLGDLHLRGKESDGLLYALEKERADSAAAAA
jgi:hypothetical protein